MLKQYYVSQQACCSSVNTGAQGWFSSEKEEKKEKEMDGGEENKEGSNLEWGAHQRTQDKINGGESQSCSFKKSNGQIFLCEVYNSLPLVRGCGRRMSLGCGRWMTENQGAPGRNLQSLYKSWLVGAQWPQKSLWSAASQRV